MPAAQMLTSLNSQTVDRLCRMFGRVMPWPSTDFVWVCDVDERKGLDIGTAYRNDKQARVFTHHIAEVARSRIRDDVQVAPFLALISNGSTDSAALEAEMIYVCHACHGVIGVELAGYVNVEHANAP